MKSLKNFLAVVALMTVSEATFPCAKTMAVLYGGLFDQSTGIMHEFKEKLLKLKNIDQARYYTWSHGDIIRSTKEIRKYIKNCRNAEVILIGHSLGGGSAYDVANRLSDGREKRNIKLITLDPVSSFDHNEFLWSGKCFRRVGPFRWMINVIRIQMHDRISMCPRERNLDKPKGTNYWINVWVPQENNNLRHTVVTKVGDVWGRQKYADTNIALVDTELRQAGFPTKGRPLPQHSEARIMFVLACQKMGLYSYDGECGIVR